MRRTLLLGASLVAASCGGDPAVDDPDEEARACIATGRGDTYVVGLERAGIGGVLDFKLMSATPAPPGFNNNAWIIQINTMAAGVVGSPATDAMIRVTPFMPDHQHGTPIKATVRAVPEAGQYELTPINMWMPGYWEITLDATIAAPAGTVSDRVVYKFCIQA